VPATSKSDGISGTHCAIQRFTIIMPSLQRSSLLWCCRVRGFQSAALIIRTVSVPFDRSSQEMSTYLFVVMMCSLNSLVYT
jgi:hypothetical protein